MIYTHDISRAFDDIIGKEGADKTRFTAILKKAAAAIDVLRAHRQDNSWPILNIAGCEDDLEGIEHMAAHINAHFETLVVIGMGGSSGGGKTLIALAENPFAAAKSNARIHFIDNIDPHTFDQLRNSLDLKSTLFLIVSKSGGTAEVLAQLLVLLEDVKNKLGADAVSRHFIAVTEPGDHTLGRIASAHNIKRLEHDPGIGGRFAALTVVGLLPAKVAGLDIRAIRKGALRVIEHSFTQAMPEPARGAALSYALMERGKTISVMMPYCDRLNVFSIWYQQIWAESLGKKGKGTTPLRSLGAFDQHSQLQLYLDGPRDKFLTLIFLAQADQGAAIPEPGDASLAYLRKHTVGDVMDAEQRATAETLTRGRCPVRLFTLPRLDEEMMGALMMHFILETILMAELLSIDAFDQPAVEESKRLARTYLMQAK